MGGGDKVFSLVVLNHVEYGSQFGRVQDQISPTPLIALTSIISRRTENTPAAIVVPARVDV